MEAVEEFEVNGYTVRIIPDDSGTGDPREATNLGVMLANGHRRYTLGDAPHQGHIPEYAQAEAIVDRLTVSGQLNGAAVMAAFKEELGATVVLPLWLLDHSGLSMSTHSFSHVDPGEWDSGIVGFIFDTPRTREECGTPPESVEEVLRSEVSEYDKFLRGEVYGYEIDDPDGDTVESVWGFLGYEFVQEEAKGAAEALPAPQWVVVFGDLTRGIDSIEGPYSDQDDAILRLAGGSLSGRVMVLKPALTTVRATDGEA